MSPQKILSDIGRWGAVPEWLIDAGVSANAIKLFALLACKYADRHTAETRGTSRGRLAKEMGCSRPTVDRAKTELRKAGALVVAGQADEDGQQLANTYMLVYCSPMNSRVITRDPPPLIPHDHPSPEGEGSKSRPTDGTPYQKMLFAIYAVWGWDPKRRAMSGRRADLKAAGELVKAGRTTEEAEFAAKALAQDEWIRTHGGPNIRKLISNFENLLEAGKPEDRPGPPRPRWADFETAIDPNRYPEANARADFDRETATWEERYGE